MSRILWLPDALRAEGLEVSAVAGWRTRGNADPFDPRGVMFHHTASARTAGACPALNTVTYGRPDLPGPIANVLVCRNGSVKVIASGRANHAGYGGPWRDIPADSGNSYLVGVEVENDGRGEEWTETVLGACDRVFAAVLRRIGRDASWCVGHKEYTSRKIDPAGVNMDRYRRRLQDYMDNGGDDEMFELWKAGWDAHEAGVAFNQDWKPAKKDGWRDRNVVIRDASAGAPSGDMPAHTHPPHTHGVTVEEAG